MSVKSPSDRAGQRPSNSRSGANASGNDEIEPTKRISLFAEGLRELMYGSSAGLSWRVAARRKRRTAKVCPFDVRYLVGELSATIRVRLTVAKFLCAISWL
jgi:hypothetical protein